MATAPRKPPRLTMRRRALMGVAAVAVALAALQGPAAGRLTGLYFAPIAERVPLPDDPTFPCEELSIPARDGSPLGAWLFPSTGSPQGALIVFAHGNYGHLGKQWRRVARLAPRGFDVLMFDYRGFGDSPGRASRRNAREDVESVLDFAVARATARGQRVIVLGQSMGGALALEACEGRADISAIIADCPFDRWSGVGAHALAESAPARALLRVGLGLALAGTGRDPVDAVRGLGVPLLVIAGERDSITPVEGARAIAAAAPDARLLELPGAPHVGQRSPEDESLVQDAMVAFAQDAMR